MKRMSEFYKNYADKMDFLTNGINWEECNKIVCSNSEKYKNTIVLIGGGRITKRNRQVCQAVEELNDEGNDLHVYVYGGIERNSNEVNLIKQYKCERLDDFDVERVKEELQSLLDEENNPNKDELFEELFKILKQVEDISNKFKTIELNDRKTKCFWNTVERSTRLK